MPTPNDQFAHVTRFELIDSGGRRIVVWDPGIKLTAMLQDDGRTLKVFADGDLSSRWIAPQNFAGDE